jgi:hypothetical protein
MCLRVSYKNKNMGKNFFSCLKSLKKGVRSGSGSISQGHGSADPDPHQNVKMSRIPNPASYTAGRAAAAVLLPGGAGAALLNLFYSILFYSIL